MKGGAHEMVKIHKWYNAIGELRYENKPRIEINQKEPTGGQEKLGIHRGCVCVCVCVSGKGLF